ncbi:MAG: hypothetical protein JSV03_07625 [Planctomycetota bacterium]|nr:MAG: hypothetical protein JSV03_07625 [Planctomycetota bacterium]
MDLVFTDDCATSTSTHTRTINLEVTECEWSVTPYNADRADNLCEDNVCGDVHILATCSTAQNFDFTVTNDPGSIGSLNYTVEECDAGGNSLDHTWLTLSKTSGGPIAPGDSDTLVASVTSVPGGTTGYVKFTPSGCGSGLTEQIREIMLIDMTDAGYKFSYLGDVHPTTANSCNHIPPEGNPSLTDECHLVHVEGGGIVGTVVPDLNIDPNLAADNGTAFLLDSCGSDCGTDCTTGPDPIGRHMYRTDIPDKNDLYGNIGSTMVARIKVVKNSNTGGNLHLFDDGSNGGFDSQPHASARIEWGGCGATSTRDIRERWLDISNTNIVPTGQPRQEYWTIRVLSGYGKYGNRTILVYFEEGNNGRLRSGYTNPVLEIHGPPHPGIYYHKFDGFGFGTWNTGSQTKLYVDWMSFTNMGMYAPGEEDDCIGSLLPAFVRCNDPFADIDGPDTNGDGVPDGDGDVDQDDFAVFQVCYTGPGDPGGVFDKDNCDCFDKEPLGGDDDIDENDFSLFQNCASGPGIPADTACDDGL